MENLRKSKITTLGVKQKSDKFKERYSTSGWMKFFAEIGL